MTLEAVREAIDTCDELEPAVFARRARNALALAIVGGSRPTPPAHDPPVDRLRELVGEDLASHLATVYEGGEEWTTHAIDALEPLNALARA